MDPVPAIAAIPCPVAVAPESAMAASVVTIKCSARSIRARIACLSSGPPLMPRQADSKHTLAASNPARARAFVHGALESGAPFLVPRVVAWAGLAGAQHAPALVPDQHRGAGLSTVHSQKKSHGSRYSLAPLYSPNRRMPHRPALLPRTIEAGFRRH